MLTLTLKEKEQLIGMILDQDSRPKISLLKNLGYLVIKVKKELVLMRSEV